MRIIKHVSALLTIVYVYIVSGYAQTSSSLLVSISGTKTCKAPPQPQNGHWKLHQSQCSNTEQDCNISEGMNLGLDSYLIYSCNPGYKIKDSMNVSCIEGEWLNIPSCIEIRCQKLSTTSINAHCIYNYEWVSCDYPVLSGTRAKLSCRDSYQYESNLPSRRRNFARCNENGQWVPQPITCVPDRNNATFIEILNDRIIIHTKTKYPNYPNIHVRVSTSNNDLAKEKFWTWF